MKHTTTTETNLAHIERLRVHGTKIRVNGELKEINSFFWDGAVSECITKGYNAIVYEMAIPETDEPMAICIWKLFQILNKRHYSSSFIIPDGFAFAPCFSSFFQKLLE